MSAELQQPKKPNVLVTGTPGTGKTTLSKLIEQEFGMTHIEVGKVVKEKKFYSEYDPVMDTHDVEEDDEDRLLDYLEPMMVEGGVVIDYHGSSLFPERWFNSGAVVVLHAETDILYDRLVGRGYNAAKREENMAAEITCVCENEAMESYDESIVMIVQNNSTREMDETLDALRQRLGL